MENVYLPVLTAINGFFMPRQPSKVKESDEEEEKKEEEGVSLSGVAEASSSSGQDGKAAQEVSGDVIGPSDQAVHAVK